MIVIPDDKAFKQPSDSKVQTERLQADPDEPPPSYSPQTESVANGTSSPPPSSTFKTKPTNFLALFNEHNAIRGEFVIDPSLDIPSSMLPPLGEGETEDDRKNLSLNSKSSTVHAEIWLLGSPNDNLISGRNPRRTTIALASEHGNISAQVQTLDGAAPYALTARAPHGGIRLVLPRSFQGLISLSTRHGSISLSDALVQNATQLSQLDTTRRYFVGDFRALGEDVWEGDQVEIDATHGSIRVKYVDEATTAQGKKGLLSRLFGK